MIGVVPGQLITEHLLLDLPRDGTRVVADPGLDLEILQTSDFEEGVTSTKESLIGDVTVEHDAVDGTKDRSSLLA